MTRSLLLGWLMVAGCGASSTLVPVPASSEPVEVETLADLVYQHRPASFAVPMEEGRVGIPADWRTLPLTAVLWEGAPLRDRVLIEDLLLAPSAPSWRGTHGPAESDGVFRTTPR